MIHASLLASLASRVTHCYTLQTSYKKRLHDIQLLFGDVVLNCAIRSDFQQAKAQLSKQQTCTWRLVIDK